MHAGVPYVHRPRPTEREDQGRNQRTVEAEIGDVLGFLLLFAEREGVDIEQALENKWFKRLPQ